MVEVVVVVVVVVEVGVEVVVVVGVGVEVVVVVGVEVGVEVGLTATFTIDGRLCGMNDFIKLMNRNRYVGAKMKKDETARCAWTIQIAKVPAFVTPVGINFKWIEPNNKRDIDNIVSGGTKVILDALVLTGKLPNDTRKWVRGLSHEFPPSEPKQPRVEVTITEV